MKESMKQIFILTGLLSATVATASMPLTGIYAGGNIGFTRFNAENKLTFDGTKVANTSRYNYSNSQDRNKPTGALFLGYGYQFSNAFYLGGEAIAQLGTTSASWYTARGISASIKQHNLYGGRLKAGFWRQNWLLYALAGFQQGRTSRAIQFPAGGIYQSNSMLLQPIDDLQHQVIKQLGAGVNWAFTTQWATQLEYAHSFYRDSRLAINHQTITFNNPKGVYWNQFYADTLWLGLRYTLVES